MSTYSFERTRSEDAWLRWSDTVMYPSNSDKYFDYSNRGFK